MFGVGNSGGVFIGGETSPLCGGGKARALLSSAWAGGIVCAVADDASVCGAQPSNASANSNGIEEKKENLPMMFRVGAFEEKEPQSAQECGVYRQSARCAI